MSRNFERIKWNPLHFEVTFNISKPSLGRFSDGRPNPNDIIHLGRKGITLFCKSIKRCIMQKGSSQARERFRGSNGSYRNAASRGRRRVDPPWWAPLVSIWTGKDVQIAHRKYFVIIEWWHAKIATPSTMAIVLRKAFITTMRKNSGYVQIVSLVNQILIDIIHFAPPLMINMGPMKELMMT